MLVNCQPRRPASRQQYSAGLRPVSKPRVNERATLRNRPVFKGRNPPLKGWGEGRARGMWKAIAWAAGSKPCRKGRMLPNLPNFKPPAARKVVQK